MLTDCIIKGLLQKQAEIEILKFISLTKFH